MSNEVHIDRLQIVELLSRYFGSIDDKRLDLAVVQATFTMGGRLVRPNGAAHVGVENIFATQSESFARFRATHHVTSDHIVDVHGDTASLRANMTAMHLWSQEKCDPMSLQTHFVAGSVVRASAVRTPEGWRFSELGVRVAWRTGDGLLQMGLAMDRQKQ